MLGLPIATTQRMDATETKAIPLFANLNDAEAANLAAMLEPRVLEPNQVLFWLGEPGREFFVIAQGKIHLTYPDHAGQEMTLAILGPGDFLGEIALLDDGPRTATARAAGTSVKLLSLDRDHFHRFITQNPLSAIHNAAILIGASGPLSDPVAWGMDVIGRQVRHLVRLIDDLLDVSRITRGKVVLQKEPVEFLMRKTLIVLDRCMTEMKPALTKAGRQKTDAETGRPLFVFDGANALKAIRTLGELKSIRAFTEPPVAAIGIGLDIVARLQAGRDRLRQIEHEPAEPDDGPVEIEFARPEPTEMNNE